MEFNMSHERYKEYAKLLKIPVTEKKDGKRVQKSTKQLRDDIYAYIEKNKFLLNDSKTI